MARGLRLISSFCSSSKEAIASRSLFIKTFATTPVNPAINTSRASRFSHLLSSITATPSPTHPIPINSLRLHQFSSKSYPAAAPKEMEQVTSSTEATPNNELDVTQISSSNGGDDKKPPPSQSSSDAKPATDSTVTPNNEVTESTQSNGADSTKPSTQESSSAPNAVDTPPAAPFLRRKKTVLMLSYCGQGYYGMQRNPDTKTIEDALLKALLASSHIDAPACDKPTLMHFQRAARTDKNVSAARQIVSMKMPDTLSLPEMNKYLPPEIRVQGFKRVTKNFDAKGNCDARTYLYMLPSFAFTPLEESVNQEYKISKEVLEKLRETLGFYLGTKNFHNFTSRKKSTDPSAKRFIMAFTASEPFTKDGMEYLVLRVKGQSFMLHQIRKMIGLVIAYMRGVAGKETFTKSWSHERIDIPKAPGVGLVLDHVHYDNYDKRYGADGIHSKLVWEEEEAQVEEFLQTFIYPVITKAEAEDKSMFEWMQTLAYHTYDVRGEGEEGGFSGIGNAAYHLGKNVKLEDSSDDEEDQPKRKRPRDD